MEHWAVLGGLMGRGRKLEPGELSSYRATLNMAAREAGIMRISAIQLPAEIVKTGVVTRSEATQAWSAGVGQGRQWVICRPLGATPTPYLALQPDLDAAPKAPF
jgi:hypothetical protein